MLSKGVLVSRTQTSIESREGPRVMYFFSWCGRACAMEKLIFWPRTIIEGIRTVIET